MTLVTFLPFLSHIPQPCLLIKNTIFSPQTFLLPTFHLGLMVNKTQFHLCLRCSYIGSYKMCASLYQLRLEMFSLLLKKNLRELIPQGLVAGQHGSFCQLPPFPPYHITGLIINI